MLKPSRPSQNPLVKRSLASAIFLGAMLAAVPTLARNGGVVQLPAAGVKMKNGLNLEVDSRGSESTGYQPIRVKFSNSPLVPSKYDRQVRITLGGIYGNGVYGRLTVSQVVEIPEGATSGEAVMAVPRDVHGKYYVRLEVREGGQRLEDLCSEFLMLNNRGGGWGGGDEAFPSLLFVSSSVPNRDDRDKMVGAANAQVQEKNPTYDLPDVRNAVNAMHDGNNANIGFANGQISDRSLLTLLENSSCLDLMPPQELPDRWIDLSTYGVIFISRGDLQKLAKDSPRRKAALQDWLAEGCVLVVYDAGDDYQHLAAIEKLLELPPQERAEKLSLGQFVELTRKLAT